MADLKQDDLSFNTRINVTFTPALTLEVFAQPLFSSVDYSAFKEFDAPRQLNKSVYGVDRGTVAEVLNPDGKVTAYQIDPDGPGGAPQKTNTKNTKPKKPSKIQKTNPTTPT